jgi:hypothetical protein
VGDGSAAHTDKVQARSRGSIFTQVMPTVHEKMGAVPTAEDQQKLDDIALGLVVPGISKAHTMDTKKERALQVLKEFPQHYWHTLYACTVPLVFASVPVIMRGYECRGWSSEVDPAVVANFASMFKYSSPDLSIGTFMLSNINAGLSMATLWTFVCVAACSWWDSKPLLKPMLKIIIPFCCVIGGLSIANRVMTYTGCPLFQGAISTMVPATLSLTCAALVSYILGNHCKMPGFGYMFTLYFALITCVTVIYELILFPLVLESDNMMKLLSAPAPRLEPRTRCPLLIHVCCPSVLCESSRLHHQPVYLRDLLGLCTRARARHATRAREHQAHPRGQHDRVQEGLPTLRDRDDHRLHLRARRVRSALRVRDRIRRERQGA